MFHVFVLPGHAVGDVPVLLVGLPRGIIGGPAHGLPVDFMLLPRLGGFLAVAGARGEGEEYDYDCVHCHSPFR